MKPEDILDAIGMADDKLIAAAEEKRRKQKQKKHLWHISTIFVSSAACICLIVFSRYFLRNNTETLNAYAISKASYPEMAAYPSNRTENTDENALMPEKNEANHDNSHTNTEAGSTEHQQQYDLWIEEQNSRLELYIRPAAGYVQELTGFFTKTMQQFLTDRAASSDNHCDTLKSSGNSKNHVYSPLYTLFIRYLFD